MERLGAVHRALSPTTTPAAGDGVLSRIAGLLGIGGGADDGDESPDPSPVTAVAGVVRGCFLRPSNEEREAAGWTPATGHFERHRTPTLSLTAVLDHRAEPRDAPTTAGAADDFSSHRTWPQPDWLEDPPERGLLCQTADAYEKLRAGLPENAALLSPERPGSGENVFVDGLEQWSLCIGDVFTVPGTQLRLEVSSPRRPCEYWNMIHGLLPYDDDGAAYQAADGEGNVRHHCLRNTLGGFFFRVLVGGELSVGDTLTLAERPHPEWTLRRVGDLVYGNAGVAREGWVAWAGTGAEREELLGLAPLAIAEWKEVIEDGGQAELRRLGLAEDAGGAPADGSAAFEGRPVAAALHAKLSAEFPGADIAIEDESAEHKDDEEAKAYGGGESHLRLSVVSEAFAGKSKVQRQREVYRLLAEELRPAAEGGKIHALSLSAKAPGE